MFNHSEDTAIEYLKGVGPERAAVLKSELNINTFRDLLYHFPFRYVDRSIVHSISTLNPSITDAQLEGKLIHVQKLGMGRNARLIAKLQDKTGSIELIWFKGIKWIEPSLHIGKMYRIFGKTNVFKNKINISHPEMQLLGEGAKANIDIQPIYHSTEKLQHKGLNSKGIQKLVQHALESLKENIPQLLPEHIRTQCKVMGRKASLIGIHFPSNIQYQKHAIYSLKFEELFFVQLWLLKMKSNQNKKFKGFVFEKVGAFFNQYYNEFLDFELTSAQKRVVKEIRVDMGRGTQMNRLLQGDVGSGKTVVSILSILIALDNGFQAAIMAPTEILAKQHYLSFKEPFDKLGIQCAFISGSTKTSEKKEAIEALKSGACKVVIGTHALIEKPVQFQNLGLVVIDEQHKFGVAQRAKLWNKNPAGLPHVLIMTATPIPRTLAMTLYGDLDTSVIDELPPGRKPVKTVHQYEKNRLKVFGFIKEQIAKGRQVYIVYPLIEESETLDYNNLMSGYESISKAFPLPEYKIGVLHGRMNPKDKEFEMRKFSSGETHIMVSTTVIEVGVNVPNASVMIIENSEKFGLSQLHQLRGRVGRGADESFCVLLSSYKLSADAKIRIHTMCNTTDGFKVAEADLKLRGPGDLMGTRQSGLLDLKIASLVSDEPILSLARSVAKSVLEKDPDLEKSEHTLLRVEVEKRKAQKNWGMIS